MSVEISTGGGSLLSNSDHHEGMPSSSGKGDDQYGERDHRDGGGGGGGGERLIGSEIESTEMTMMSKFSCCNTVSEIEELEDEELSQINNATGGRGVPMPSIKEDEEIEGSLFSFDFHGSGDDIVYVAVAGGIGESANNSSSMDALLWTLSNASTPSSATLVFLIHVYPELRFIPTPLGKLPISQANPEQKQIHMAQERSKRREYLQKFLDLCSASKVKVDTILIESDMEAKAILDLIPILNIRKLVLGAPKSSLLKKLKQRKGNGVADLILQNAPEFCEVKIICQGKEVILDDHLTDSPSSASSNLESSPGPQPHELDDQSTDSFGYCKCFRPKAIS